MRLLGGDHARRRKISPAPSISIGTASRLSRAYPVPGSGFDFPLSIGAGEGNRTLVVSLGSFCSAIELHPQCGGILMFPRLCQAAFGGRLFGGYGRRGGDPYWIATPYGPTGVRDGGGGGKERVSRGKT